MHMYGNISGFWNDFSLNLPFVSLAVIQGLKQEIKVVQEYLDTANDQIQVPNTN